MRLFTRAGYRPKRIETKEQSDGLLHLLALSAVGLCACLICLCGVSWAWFTATTSTGTTVIQAATYTVNVSADKNENVEITPESGTTTVTFTAAGEYTITLTPSGTAQNGYCKISYADADYYTEQFTSAVFRFTVNADENSELTVTPQWGSYSGDPNLSSGDTIGNTTGNTQRENPVAAATTTEPTEPTTTTTAPSRSPEESAASTPDTPADSATAQPEGVTGGEQAPAPEDSNR